jgi:UPF0755 protein
LLITSVSAYIILFAPPDQQGLQNQFVNPLPPKGGEVAIEGYEIPRLKAEGFIKSILGFEIAFDIVGGHEILPGGYQISSSMSAWRVAMILKAGPGFKWVTIPEGLRKEQIADILAGALNWSVDDVKNWVTLYTAMDIDHVEGVYFPDTYLMPVNESPLQIAERLRQSFNEKFVAYSKEAIDKNIKWTTVVKLASIVEREAAGSDDMPLIAGIIWNRLDKNMPLQVDSTVQYARDSLLHYGASVSNQALKYTIAGGWWAPIKPEDEKIDSPFNTYKYKGLPPHPIDNPGIDSINAVLNPTKTDCLYYLHDGSKVIHCSKTFEEHQANIKRYLR